MRPSRSFGYHAKPASERNILPIELNQTNAKPINRVLINLKFQTTKLGTDCQNTHGPCDFNDALASYCGGAVRLSQARRAKPAAVSAMSMEAARARSRRCPFFKLPCACGSKPFCSHFGVGAQNLDFVGILVGIGMFTGGTGF